MFFLKENIFFLYSPKTCSPKKPSPIFHVRNGYKMPISDRDFLIKKTCSFVVVCLMMMMTKEMMNIYLNFY